MVNDYPATPKQTKAIAKLASLNGIRYEVEQEPMTRDDARNLQYRLLKSLREKGAHKVTRQEFKC